VYNSFNGSAAGVSQLLARTLKGTGTGQAAIDSAKALTDAALTVTPESNVVTVGLGTIAPCKLYATGDTSLPDLVIAGTTTPITRNANKVVCTTAARTRADIAISDMAVAELTQLYKFSKAPTLTNVVQMPFGMQGFGVAVNNSFYNALQTHQKLTGKLPGSCTVGDYTQACQPNIPSAIYASLINKTGEVKSAAGFFPGSSDNAVKGTFLTLARRDNLSGTQAAAQMHFLGSSVCKNPAVYKHVQAADSVNYSNLDIIEGAQTANVEENLRSSTRLGTSTPHFAIGVVTLSASGAQGATGATAAYKFVKLDGVSPNFDFEAMAQNTGGNLRKNMIDGSWAFQYTPYVMYLKTDLALKDAKARVIESVTANLKEASKSNLTGVSYFTNDADNPGDQSLVKRAFKTTKGVETINNCAPLMTAVVK
jgi:hypothetical protein